MKNLILGILVLIPSLLVAQTKTYFDVYDEECDPLSAKYYRIIKFDPEDKTYLFEEYFMNGKRKSVGNFTNKDFELKQDVYISWFENGQISDSGNYINAKKEGLWNYYFENSQLAGQVNYEKDEIISQKYWNEDGSIHSDSSDVTTSPEPFGGLEALYKIIAKNLQYPATARKNKIQGKVYVTFIVDKSGEITHPIITKSVDPELDLEVLRIVKLFPKWKPAKQNNRVINTKITLPITFKIR